MLISIKTREEDGSRYMMCAGTVTREVKTGTTAKGTPKAEFGMKYAKGEFMNVSAVGDDDVTRMAACLEKGDAVLVCGVWKTRRYTTRDGEQKEWSELHAEFVAPQTVMAAVLGLLAAKSEKPRSSEPAKPMEHSGSQAGFLDSQEDAVLPWEQLEEDEPYDYVPQI
jgi:single-stranded DNA-binding protein